MLSPLAGHENSSDPLHSLQPPSEVFSDRELRASNYGRNRSNQLVLHFFIGFRGIDLHELLTVPLGLQLDLRLILNDIHEDFMPCNFHRDILRGQVDCQEYPESSHLAKIYTVGWMDIDQVTQLLDKSQQLRFALGLMIHQALHAFSHLLSFIKAEGREGFVNKLSVLLAHLREFACMRAIVIFDTPIEKSFPVHIN